MPKMKKCFFLHCPYLLSIDDRVHKAYAIGRLVQFGMMCEINALIQHCYASPAIVIGKFGNCHEFGFDVSHHRHIDTLWFTSSEYQLKAINKEGVVEMLE